MELVKGVGSCPGIVAGKVYLHGDPLKPAQVEEGAILVVPYTTPVLATGIANAAGLVTDIGGPTSHAAVIAREFGIPCVTNAKNATATLRNGQKIRVDGTAGVIYADE